METTGTIDLSNLSNFSIPKNRVVDIHSGIQRTNEEIGRLETLKKELRGIRRKLLASGQTILFPLAQQLQDGTTFGFDRIQDRNLYRSALESCLDHNERSFIQAWLGSQPLSTLQVIEARLPVLEEQIAGLTECLPSEEEINKGREYIAQIRLEIEQRTEKNQRVCDSLMTLLREILPDFRECYIRRRECIRLKSRLADIAGAYGISTQAVEIPEVSTQELVGLVDTYLHTLRNGGEVL